MLLAGLSPERWLTAATLLGAYFGLCLLSFRRAARRTCQLTEASDWSVVYASQTGQAAELATQTVRALELSGASVRQCPLDRLDGAALAAGGRFLFVVSTAGQGDAPDNGARFARQVLTADLDLRAVDFALLALGDRAYPQYCGFGRHLEAWLVAHGAVCCWPRIEVNRGDPAAIATWQAQLARLTGAAACTPAEEGSQIWRLLERRHLNPGSPGGAVFYLTLAPLAGHLPAWEAGDLALIAPPDEASSPRHYSIASTPASGRLCLLVRCHDRADGTPGRVSGWLSSGLKIGETLALRVQKNVVFHQGENIDRPAILIGNGVGLAGLMSHLRARIERGQYANWLIFGERSRAADFHCASELQGWLAAGQLQRLDAVFSRSGETPRYVQDCLAAQGAAFCTAIDRGAAVYVCGSRAGMAEAVDQVIRALLGAAACEELRAAGRYRRDVF